MIFSAAGFRQLRFPIIAALLALIVAVFLAGGSYWYWQAEKKNDQVSLKGLNDFRGRLSVLRRERDDLRNSSDTYKSILVRGAFLPEQRLDLIEAMTALKSRHNLVSLEYEIAPQRNVRFAAGSSYGAIDIRGSRITLKVRALHDGDLVAFLDEFPRIQHGFFPVDRCTIRRTAESLQQRVQTADSQPDEAAEPAAPKPITGALEAECVLDWITLYDRSNAGPGKTS